MNLAYRKLALLEKDFKEKEEYAKVNGFYSCPIDKDLQGKVSYLLDKVRNVTII